MSEIPTSLLIPMLESAHSLMKAIYRIKLTEMILPHHHGEIMREIVRCVSNFVDIDEYDDEISEHELNDEIHDLECRIYELSDEILSLKLNGSPDIATRDGLNKSVSI